MVNYKLAIKEPTSGNPREVEIIKEGEAVSSGFTELVASVPFDQTDSKALFHLIRDALYHEGITDTQKLVIKYKDTDVISPNFHIWEREVTVYPEEEYHIQVYNVPDSLTSSTITAESGDDSVAEINEDNSFANGVVVLEGVDIGETTVTITVLGVAHEIKVNVPSAALTGYPLTLEEEEEQQGGGGEPGDPEP